MPVDNTTGVDYGKPRRGPEPGQPGGPSPEELQCMIEALGEAVVKQLGPGGREATSKESEIFQHCFP